MALKSAVHARRENKKLPPLPAYGIYTGETVVELAPTPKATTTLAQVRFRRRLVEFASFLREFFAWLWAGTAAIIWFVLNLTGRALAWSAALAIFFWLLTPGPLVQTGPRLVDARQSVVDFHRALDGKAYYAAYSLLSPVWQKKISYAQFERGFGRDHLQNMRVTNVFPLSNDRAFVEVALTLNRGKKKLHFAGYYVVAHNGYRWNLDGGRLDERPVLTGRALPSS